MTEFLFPDIEQRLRDALREEAEIAMTLTNTPQQLERFEHETAGRRRRARILIAAAAAAAIAAIAYAATTLGGSAGHRGQGPITHHPKPVQPKPAAVGQVTLGIKPSVLPAASVHRVAGPDTLGQAAFGAVWANNGHDVFRLSADGTRVLSKMPFTQINTGGDDVNPPFRCGSVMLMGASVHGQDVYLRINARGQRIGQVAVDGAGPGAGDATGAWVISNGTSIAQISADGSHVVRQVDLGRDSKLVAITVGGGSVWVLDNTTSSLIRLDASTGKVLGHTSWEQFTEMITVSYGDGAAYVATNGYDLSRVDPATMKVTAVETEQADHQWSWQSSVIAPNGELWTNVGPTAVAQLDPKTLRQLRFVQTSRLALGVNSGGGAAIVVTGNRLFTVNLNRRTVESFLLR